MGRCAAISAAAALAFCTAGASADLLTIESTFSGGLHADGSYSPGFMNYYVGYSIPSTPIERRNYFVFDLGDVSESIVSAKLKLYLPGDPAHPGEPCGYISPTATEDYLVTSSAFPWTSFADASGMMLPPPMIAALYGTLGTGFPFALATISADACGSDVVMEITPEGLAALNGSLGDAIVMGGRLTDLMDVPGMPPSELVFAYTDIPSPILPLPRLEIETIPEPTTGALLLLGAAAIGVRRGRERAARRPSAR